MAHDNPLSCTGWLLRDGVASLLCYSCDRDPSATHWLGRPTMMRQGEQTRQDILRQAGARAHPRPRESDHECSAISSRPRHSAAGTHGSCADAACHGICSARGRRCARAATGGSSLGAGCRRPPTSRSASATLPRHAAYPGVVPSARRLHRLLQPTLACLYGALTGGGPRLGMARHPASRRSRADDGHVAHMPRCWAAGGDRSPLATRRRRLSLVPLPGGAAARRAGPHRALVWHE